MSETGWLAILAWVLQPCSAVYALRISRLFGTRRVGWCVWFSFFCLALIHIIHLVNPRGPGIGFMDLLISLLLLIGLAHIDAVFGREARFEGKESQLRTELRSVTRRAQDFEDANVLLHRLNTQYEQRAQELEESARQFQSLFRDNPQAMWIFDLRSLNFLEVNRAALREYGYTEAEFMALTPRSLHLEPDLETFIQDAARPKPPGSQSSLWQHCLKDGSIIDVEVTACDLFYAQRPARLVLVHNITCKRQLESEQRKNLKLEAFTDMAGGFVQQFSTSFIALDERVNRLVKKQIDPSIADELRQIAAAASRAATVSRQLLTLSGKQHLARESLDLNTATKQCVAALQPLIEKHIKIRLAFASNLPPIEADPAALQQVILNLVLNAREAMPTGGTLTISTSALKVDSGAEQCLETERGSDASGHFVCLTIGDTGSGMSQEVQERLFEPFFTTRTARKAAGLGLCLARAMVKQHSGWIDFQTEQNAGSRFSIFLPAQ
jgi:two-component system cell cycle sensor histidine kinase/response regulator CckA